MATCRLIFPFRCVPLPGMAPRDGAWRTVSSITTATDTVRLQENVLVFSSIHCGILAPHHLMGLQRSFPLLRKMHCGILAPHNLFVSCPRRSMSSVPRISEDGPLQRPKKQLHCPFEIRRTKSDNMPVYVYHRRNRNICVTVVRKVKGDQEEFRKELEFLCRCRITVGKSGFLEIPGNHRRTVSAYLRGIGY
eukprot:gnl/MRDRNA2_/MRDRNA2_210538_c0_seq1.p1 gnl/MRDRNA2_/MRDRNA2_210538_c0~~gnl/MRDRNA2_/MRDRNA2_210538_c0_seq1.p1  ORF type:complete len:192 (+),score=7.13 gnl/MRDRNA2_/MRDRNA2_210538_c0_seq1:76-651(+)